jgi:hypothetical protein
VHEILKECSEVVTTRRRVWPICAEDTYDEGVRRKDGRDVPRASLGKGG